MVISADKNVRYEDVINVMDILQQQHIQKVGLLTQVQAMSATAYYEPHKVPAGVLALVVHSLFFALLYFGFNWNRQVFSNPQHDCAVMVRAFLKRLSRNGSLQKSKSFRRRSRSKNQRNPTS